MGLMDMKSINSDLFYRIIQIDTLKKKYEGLRFNGDIWENYICKDNIVSKSKSGVEVCRRYSRDIIWSLKNRIRVYQSIVSKNLVERENINEKIKYIESLIEFEKDRILLQFLKYDIKNNYLIWVKVEGVEWLCWVNYGYSGVDSDKLEWIKNEELKSEFWYEGVDLDRELKFRRTTLDQYYRKGLVRDKDYIGWIPSFKWYKNKIDNNELIIMSEWEESKKKWYFSYIPIVTKSLLDEVISSYEKGEYNSFKYNIFKWGKDFNEYIVERLELE